jgi:hypothetical protein
MSATVTKQPVMTEAQMLAGIKAAAKGLGFLVFHNTYAIGSDRGFPDLVIVGYGRSWFLELKGPKGRIRPEQTTWIRELIYAGHIADIIWPDDYDEMLEALQVAYMKRVTA